MNRHDEIAALNRIHVVLNRSLPVYLAGMKPWARHGAEEALDVLAEIGASDRKLADRVAESIYERRGQPEAGHFPLEFTAENDLAVDYMVRKALERQRRSLDALEDAARQLADAADLKPLADEVVAAARGHVRRLEELDAGELSHA